MFGCDFCGKSLSEWDYMAECGHIICGYNCFNIYEESCPICKKKCKFTIIGEKVPMHGSGFLTSTKSLFSNAEKIIEFRFNALTNLVEYLRAKIAKQNKVIDQAKHELKQVRHYKLFRTL
ncbi:hypothetical protein BD408DRAFT_19836 [Parasitella parasitica]|nr:hypothetical protein BD408DRAFT_19836 [Parasitella parasitica]